MAARWLTQGPTRRLLAHRLPGVAAALVVTALVSSCSTHQRDNLPRPTVEINLLAVLPIEPAEEVEDTPLPEGAARRPRLTADAGRAVTAQVYAGLTDRSDYRFVPDPTVAQALKNPDVSSKTSLADKARALGKVVDADAVIFGTVWRFQERVGTELGATQPASVAFALQLVETASGNVIWQGRFDETQKALTADFLKFWMFWSSGGRWLTARELTQLGVERLMPDMFAAAADYTPPESD